LVTKEKHSKNLQDLLSDQIQLMMLLHMKNRLQPIRRACTASEDNGKDATGNIPLHSRRDGGRSAVSPSDGKDGLHSTLKQREETLLVLIVIPFHTDNQRTIRHTIQA
jgi:hypothetical protein